MSGFFITSSGTGIGKTLVTTALCWQLREQGNRVTALKPVISGYTSEDPNTDSALILKSLGKEITSDNVAAISPWRYHAPLAPNMAAAREGNPVDMSKLAAFCKQRAEQSMGVTLVEGVGGVMAPVAEGYTVLDWMHRLSWPVILVTGSYLGAISHTLTAVEVLKQRQLELAGIVVSESENKDVLLSDTVSTLAKFLPAVIPVMVLPRLEPQEALWTAVPSISELCSV